MTTNEFEQAACTGLPDGTTTAWDLAGSWPDDAIGFTVGTGTVVWEDAQATRNQDGRVRIARLVPQDDGTIRQMNRYVDAETRVTLVFDEDSAALRDAWPTEDGRSVGL